MSFVQAISFEDATPGFVDMEPVTYNLGPVDLAHKITRRTRAMVAVDLFGHPVHLQPDIEERFDVLRGRLPFTEEII